MKAEGRDGEPRLQRELEMLIIRLRKGRVDILNSSPYHSLIFKRRNFLFFISNRN